MINYLGAIGDNQHKSQPGKVSKKVCYPLPRDIIARTMGRMNISVLKSLLSAMEDKEITIIYEALDAIGYMCFYNDITDEHSRIKILLSCFERNRNDEIIRWKIARCMSSFNCNESIDILKKMYTQEKEQVIREEIKRSLSIIEKNNVFKGEINA
jgi:hypothetical protein